MRYDQEKTGKLIHDERVKRGWSQAKLGELINVSHKQVSNYELGKLIPPMDVLFALCEVFGCELGYLLGEEDYSEGTRLMNAFCKYSGLAPEAVEALRRAAGTGGDSLGFGHEPERYGRIVGALLASEGFPRVVEAMAELAERDGEAREARAKGAEGADLDEAIDGQRDLAFAAKVARFELHEELEALIGELFPRD